jgi:hypothetical protein
MKTKTIIAILILVLIIIIIGVLLYKKEVKVENMKTLKLFYTRGYYMNADVRYELKCDEKCMVTFKDIGKNEEEAIHYEISKEKVKQLEEVLKEYHVGKWDGFHKSDKNVLDGDSFSFYAEMEDGTSISASGYMKYPKDYGKVVSEIEKILSK